MIDTLDKTQWILAGLGNPGAEYEGTRHNIGKAVIEYFVQQGHDMANVQVLTVDTYMNLSGGPVAKALQKSPESKLIIVHDDIDLLFGEVKVSESRGAGGQKGVEDIIKALGTKDFVRVRIGIVPVYFGKPRKPKGSAVARFVLKKFGILERNQLPEIVGRASKAILEVVESGAESAMNKFN